MLALVRATEELSVEQLDADHRKDELEYGIFGWFLGFFSSLVCRIELILFPLVLYFSPDRF